MWEYEIVVDTNIEGIILNWMQRQGVILVVKGAGRRINLRIVRIVNQLTKRRSSADGYAEWLQNIAVKSKVRSPTL